MDIIKKLPAMPCTLIIIAVWIIVWFLSTQKEIAPILCGKGLSVIGNEYYRIFTAGLVHTNIFHLIVNVSALFWIGFLYEEYLGSIRYLTVGIICAAMAQFIFLCVYQSAESSIGGSIYNFALCGFGLTLQFLIPDFPKITLSTWSGNWIAIYLISSNIPTVLSLDISGIIIHGIAFAVGILAGIICWLTGLK